MRARVKCLYGNRDCFFGGDLGECDLEDTVASQRMLTPRRQNRWTASDTKDRS